MIAGYMVNTVKKWAEASEGQKWSLKDGKYSLVETAVAA